MALRSGVSSIQTHGRHSQSFPVPLPDSLNEHHFPRTMDVPGSDPFFSSAAPEHATAPPAEYLQTPAKSALTGEPSKAPRTRTEQPHVSLTFLTSNHNSTTSAEVRSFLESLLYYHSMEEKILVAFNRLTRL